MFEITRSLSLLPAPGAWPGGCRPSLRTGSPRSRVSSGRATGRDNGTPTRCRSPRGGGPILDRVLGDEACVVARAARDDHDLVDLEELSCVRSGRPECDCPSAVSLPSNVSATARGCSCISLLMKSSCPAFCAASRSQSTWRGSARPASPSVVVTFRVPGPISAIWSSSSAQISAGYAEKRRDVGRRGARLRPTPRLRPPSRL